LPNSRFNKALDIAQGAKALLKPESGDSHEKSKHAWGRVVGYRRKLSIKRREASHIRRKLRAAQSGVERFEHKKNKKSVQQEILQLQMKLGIVKRGAGDQDTGALPDFLVIGAKKAGTTYLYRLLSQHPLVEPAASKEIHFFDALYEEGVEWYRQCFPAPRRKEGRTTITGEATPYMANRHSAQRAAEVAPRARLIALLRNPVDRAYSDYQQMARTGRETRTFEEAIGMENAQPSCGAGTSKEHEDLPRLDDNSKYLSRSVYVDHLLLWSEFFGRERMLVLKSEDFFARPQETLGRVLRFLDLPPQELKPPRMREKRNRGSYEQKMDPETRRRLEEYFGPHNRRLYGYLGRDLGW
jgi:hypothetical protein